MFGIPMINLLYFVMLTRITFWATVSGESEFKKKVCFDYDIKTFFHSIFSLSYALNCGLLSQNLFKRRANFKVYLIL